MIKRFIVALLLLANCPPLIGLSTEAIAQGTQAGITPSSNKTLSVSGTSSNVQLGAFGTTVIIRNTGAQTAFLAFGAASSTVATTSSWPILSGETLVFNLPGSYYIAGITGSATTTLTIGQGSGLPILGYNAVGSTGGGGGAEEVNVTQFSGANVVTGTGISGAGIPRVTVSSDSFPATQPVSAASGAFASGSLTSGAMVDLVAAEAPVAPATATATKSLLTGCQGTTGAVAFTNGQQGTESCDTNGNKLVSAGGAPNIATSQVSVTTGNISVCAVRALRRSCMITNVTGTSAIYCGVTGVSTSTGDYLGGTAGSNKVYNTTAAVFCTVASTTQTVTVAETY